MNHRYPCQGMLKKMSRRGFLGTAGLGLAGTLGALFCVVRYLLTRRGS